MKYIILYIHSPNYDRLTIWFDRLLAKVNLIKIVFIFFIDYYLAYFLNLHVFCQLVNYTSNRVGKNDIGAPKMRNIFWSALFCIGFVEWLLA